eukprot:1990277-Heterocapsa_arctica.AAC.1
MTPACFTPRSHGGDSLLLRGRGLNPVGEARNVAAVADWTQGLSPNGKGESTLPAALLAQTHPGCATRLCSARANASRPCN